MKQVEARQPTDAVRYAGTRPTSRVDETVSDAAGETQFPPFNLHRGGKKGQDGSYRGGCSGRLSRRQEKTLIWVRQPGPRASCQSGILKRLGRKMRVREDGSAAHRSIEREGKSWWRSSVQGSSNSVAKY